MTFFAGNIKYYNIFKFRTNGHLNSKDLEMIARPIRVSLLTPIPMFLVGENSTLLHANKCADQPPHPHSPINTLKASCSRNYELCK